MSAYCTQCGLGSPLIVAAVFGLLCGCSSTPEEGASGAGMPASAASMPDTSRSPVEGREPVSTVIDARPAALVNGRSVTWGELRATLNELAGAEALQEVVLDRRLVELVAEAGIVITEAEEVAERRRLIETLSEDPNTAIRLLEELRDRQKLGPRRFRALMRRNAMLRALVRDRVNVTEQAVDRMLDATHGPKRQVRILTVPDLASARRAIERIEAGAFFGDVAVEHSTDSSAARGGLLEPFSRLDPSYPAALREVAWRLEESGAISDPVLLDSGYAVVQLVRELPGSDLAPGDAAYVEIRERMRRLVEMNQQRILMDQLAQRILGDVAVTIFDDALNDSWQRARRLRRR